MRQAISFIGYSSIKLESHIKDMTQKYIGKKIYSYESQFLYEKNLEEGQLKTGFITYMVQKKISRIPSFIKVLKKAKKRSTQFQERNPELSKTLMSLKKDLRTL